MLIRVLTVAALASGALACSSSSSGQDGGCTDAGGSTIGDAGRVDAKPPRECGAPDASVASLAALSVTSSGASLVPAFSPGVSDYYVQCGTATNTLAISAKAPSGATVSIAIESPGGAIQTMGSPAAEQSLSLGVQEDQAIVATVTAGASSQEYWVRCLPGGFPPLQWTPHVEGCARTPGYYLIGTMSQGTPGWVIVLDTNGVPVWYNGNEGSAVYDVETLVDGGISFSAGGWHVLTLDPFQSFSPSGNGPCPYFCGAPDEHELRILPNGNFIGLTSASQGGVDLTGLTLPEADCSVETPGANSTILSCDIYEFDRSGNVVWTWKATDHFDSAKVMVVKGSGDLANECCTGDGGTYVEPFHCNSIDVDTSNGDPDNGNLLVSARHMASVFYIEKKTGKVLWKMGGSGPDSCLDNPLPVYVPVKDPFTAQHDARFQPSWKETCSAGSGQISLFDDESYTANPARGVVYDVDVSGVSGCGGGGSGGTGSAALSWEYRNTFDGGVPSSVTGSFRITADGSRIIGWGQSFPQPNGLVFTEVDEQGTDLLDLVSPNDSSSYRAVKVPLGAFELGVLRKTSGQ
jgi:arylsulfotransferase ASST